MKLDLQLDEWVAHPIEKVWSAITDRGKLARWLLENDFEPRVGHAFRLRDTPTSFFRGFVECVVLELDPPRRMVWSWNGGGADETTTRVTFELAPEGEGTRLTLRHEGEATDARGARLQHGWTRRMPTLRECIGG